MNVVLVVVVVVLRYSHDETRARAKKRSVTPYIMYVPPGKQALCPLVTFEWHTDGP